jgi:long-chain-fatty-acid--CoA ligase ACSBG
MSETTGPHTNGTYYSNRVGSIGPDRGVNKQKILKLEHEIDGDGKSGELMVYGRHIFMGYLNDEAKTQESFDEDGYLHTGDTARMDEDTFMYITGRIKELIITAGGENIAPVPIEDHLKLELPKLISNCMVVGDKRKYLSILVTLKTIVNVDTMQPSDELTPECIDYIKSFGSSSTKLNDILNGRDKIVYDLIEKGIFKN